MRIAICDDESSCRKQVQELIDEYISQNNRKDITYAVFTHGEELLEEVYKAKEFDIYILDIVMPGMNGINLGLELRSNGYDGRIIYLTSSEEFAIDSYKVRAFNYLLKPIAKSPLFSTLDALTQEISNKSNKHIIVKTKESSIKISYDNIMYAELVRRAIRYYLVNGDIIESTTIRTSFSDAMESLLQDKDFELCGVSKVVNMAHITKIDNDTLVLKDSQPIYIGTKASRSLRSIWLDYCFKEDEEK